MQAVTSSQLHLRKKRQGGYTQAVTSRHLHTGRYIRAVTSRRSHPGSYSREVTSRQLPYIDAVTWK
jgi:hypothetical protein